jgi:A nuclease of the HNH/ENDO VII superfamily with conserved WHH/Protein of unknown function (DUF4244)
MNQKKKWIQRVGRKRRGSSTMEYIIIIAVGAIFAGLLYQVFQTNEVQSSLKVAVENALNGTTHNSSADHEKKKSQLPVIQISPTPKHIPLELNNKVNPLPPQKKKEKEGLLSEVTGFFDSLGKDLDQLINDPVDYLKETVNWDELKKQYDALKGESNKFLADPKGYLTNFFNNATENLSDEWDQFTKNPKSYLSNAWDGYVKNVKNSLKGFWYGEDPKTKDKLTIPERLLGLMDIIPISPKKAVKELPEIVLEIGCGKKNNHGLNKSECKSKTDKPKPVINPNYSRNNHPKKPKNLKAPANPNFSVEKNVTFTTNPDNPDYLQATFDDGRTIEKVVGSQYAGKEVTMKTAEGNEYEVKYDEHAFPNFRKHAKKDIYGNVIEIDLPNDAIVGPSASQTKFASILLKEKYPNWKTDLGLTEEQLKALEKNRGSIGPKGWSMDARKEKLTWHHDKESGKMILVPFDLNNKFPHTGGHLYWGSQPTD